MRTEGMVSVALWMWIAFVVIIVYHFSGCNVRLPLEPLTEDERGEPIECFEDEDTSVAIAFDSTAHKVWPRIKAC